MSRICLKLVVTLTIVIAGCKPSESPSANGDSVDQGDRQPKNLQAQNPKTQRTPKQPKPEQPPITGQPDLAAADQQELIQCLGHEDLEIKQQASDRLLSQGSEAIPALIAALDDDNYHVRAGAVFSLGRYGPEAKSATAKLEALAEEDQWETVRDAARFALESIKGN